MAATVSYDLVVCILGYLENDYHDLSQAAVVNSTFSRAAAKFLYKDVVLHFPFLAQLNLRDTGSLPDPSIFVSASLPHNTCFVQSLQITGHPGASRRAQTKNISMKIAQSIENFNSLRKITLTPITFPEDIFEELLPKLSTFCPSLGDLTFNSLSCSASLVVQINNLRRLTVASPNRAILDALPHWLGRISSSLTELHLTNNCGSITPGVLRDMATPELTPTLRAFSLGLSYSLTDQDVFHFLGQFSQLQSISLQYFMQLSSPKTIPAFRSLKRFTVRHPKMGTRMEAEHLCTWIRRAITGSSLEELRLEHDESYPAPNRAPGANLSFDSLFTHLAEKHGANLRVVDLETVFVGYRALRLLCERCTSLERLAVTGGPRILIVFTDSCLKLTRLHTATFHIQNLRKSRRTVTDEVLGNLVRSVPSLRRLSIGQDKYTVRKS
ncbi:hypothetical protein C8J56DRAFT_951786 [Mycena floridula]|nr:hypothetical protein C8J56DRAFT_951786 [Mycena floridula]